jgi:hypothetical protein
VKDECERDKEALVESDVAVMPLDDGVPAVERATETLDDSVMPGFFIAIGVEVCSVELDILGGSGPVEVTDDIAVADVLIRMVELLPTIGDVGSPEVVWSSGDTSPLVDEGWHNVMISASSLATAGFTASMHRLHCAIGAVNTEQGHVRPHSVKMLHWVSHCGTILMTTREVVICRRSKWESTLSVLSVGGSSFCGGTSNSGHIHEGRN